MKWTYTQIIEIQRANESQRLHFFDPQSLRFFKSRINPNVYPGGHFITSEQYNGQPRRWTIRQCVDGVIKTIGEFQQYGSLAAAKRAVVKLTS